MLPPRWKPHPLLTNPATAAALRAAVAKLPKLHIPEPVNGKTFESRELAHQRCVDYAFTHGFELVVAGGKASERLYLRCKNHSEDTRNYRKLTEANRNRKDADGRHLRRLGRKMN